MWRRPWRGNKQVNESERDCVLSYALNVERRTVYGVAAALCVVLCGIFALWMNKQGIPGFWMILFLVLLLAGNSLQMLAECLAKLHLTPEGIDITLFNRTIRHIPVDQIRLFSANREVNRGENIDDLVICAYTLEELSELGRKHTPKIMRIPYPRWPGEFAGQYLHRRAISMRKELNLCKGLLFLDWSPERLKILRRMYPEVPWIDCTLEKYFDSQLME